jgi:hypothetical protein
MLYYILRLVPSVDSFSGLSILDCPFGILQCLFTSDHPRPKTRVNWELMLVVFSVKRAG